MKSGVPQKYESPLCDSPAVSRAPRGLGIKTLRAGVLLLCSLSSLLFASSALGATATVGLGTAEPFSVLAGSTITNTGATTMSGDLGLYPGSSVTGAPGVGGATHISDPVAIAAKTALTTAYNDAKGRPSNSGSAGTDLASQEFTAGVYNATSALLLSSGSVTLNAQGNPNAVFIFQIGEALTTSTGTTVALTNGAQACNVFWQVASSATLGGSSHFVGTLMAAESITAGSSATIEGRLLAETGAVTLHNNTITTSTCAAPSGAGTETSSGGGSTTTPVVVGAVVSPTTVASTPVASKTSAKKAAKRKVKKRARSGKKASKGHSRARPALPGKRAAFTG
jgi:Ice-binding-like